MSDNLLKRTLTMKSKIDFGFDRNLTVAEMFISGKQCQLICIYYMLEKIDFTDDVLEKLFITERIKKPGKCAEKKDEAIGNFIRKDREGKTDKQMLLAYHERKRTKKLNSKARSRAIDCGRTKARLQTEVRGNPNTFFRDNFKQGYK